MGISFPGEPNGYRAARDRLLEQEIELRRAMEAVAAARRELPPGGVVPEDYVFQAQARSGEPADVRFSELFASGKDSLVIYSMMFPRVRTTTASALGAGQQRCCPWRKAPAHRAPLSSTSSTERPSMCLGSASTSPSSGKRR